MNTDNKYGLRPRFDYRWTPIIILAIFYFLLVSSFVEGMVFFYEEFPNYIMAQAKSEEKTLPVIDINRVLTELQSIPVGKIARFLGRYLLSNPDPEDIYMEDVLGAITYLVAKQMGLESYLYPVMYTKKIYIRKDRKLVDVEVNTGLLKIEGEFGEKLWEILEVDLRTDIGMLVEHRDFIKMPGGKIDEYRIMNGGRDIDLILENFEGYEWGVAGLMLTQYNREYRTPQGTPYTEERELVLHQIKDAVNPGRYKFVATYTKRLYQPDGTLVRGEQWEFIQGNPQAVYYRKIL